MHYTSLGMFHSYICHFTYQGHDEIERTTKSKEARREKDFETGVES
jgi:hypothetical protein